MVVEVNWNRFSFCLATLQCKQLSGTSEANKSFKMRSMIDLEFRLQATPLDSFRRRRFAMLAIASFIIHYTSKGVDRPVVIARPDDRAVPRCNAEERGRMRARASRGLRLQLDRGTALRAAPR